MNIIIKSCNIQFKNPQIGLPTRAIKEHYNGRRIIVDIDGEERIFRFKKDEMPFIIDEDGMINLIKQRLEENNDA